MGLVNNQKLLARLCTEAALRQRYSADPRGVGIAFGLNPEEAEHLAALAVRQVEQFAGSLRNKRYREVTKLLPLSFLVLGDAVFSRLFRRHAARFLPSGVRKHGDDALAFAGLLGCAVSRGEAGPEWAADLVRYEAARLAASIPGRRCTLLFLRHALADMVACTRTRRAIPHVLPTRWSVAIWFRASPMSPLRHVHVSWPVRSPKRDLVPVRLLAD
jgi:hypothetical protein